MRKGSKIGAKLTTEYPDFAVYLARGRTQDMVRLYGRTVFGNEVFVAMDTGTLARSCYLQGVTDALTALIEGKLEPPMGKPLYWIPVPTKEKP